MRSRRVLLLLLQLAAARRSLRQRHYLTRAALPDARSAAWLSILTCGDDRAWVTTVSITRDAFCYLWRTFRTHYAPAAQSSLRSQDVLGLVLYWLTDTAKGRSLQATFSVTPAAASRHLRSGMAALYKTLLELPEGAIRWPNGEEQQPFVQKIHDYEPRLTNVWGVVDGVRFRMMNPRDALVQNAYYNGWTRKCEVTNVIVYTPDGCVAWANINLPGCCHDAYVARKLFDRLQQHSPPGYRLVGDSAFTKPGGKILVPLKKGQRLSDNAEVRGMQLQLSSACIRVRQSAEWGMGMVQRVYKRLNSILPADTSYNRQLIAVCLHLLNFRTRVVGLNQIQTVYEDA